MQANKAFYALRLARTNAKHVGLRAKRAKDAETEEKEKLKA